MTTTPRADGGGTVARPMVVSGPWRGRVSPGADGGHMTENPYSPSVSINLSDQDKTTLRIAAYGAITLLSAAGAVGGSAHKIATNGSIALGSATGLVGHVLAEHPKGKELNGK